MKNLIKKTLLSLIIVYSLVMVFEMMFLPTNTLAANNTTLEVHYKGESATKHFIMLKNGTISDKIAFRYGGKGTISTVTWSSSNTAVMKIDSTEGTKANKVCKIKGVANGAAKLQLAVKVKSSDGTYKTYNEYICISVWSNISNRWGITNSRVTIYRGASEKDYEVSASKGTIPRNTYVMVARECKDYYFIYADYEGENNGLEFSDGTSYGFVKKSDVKDYRTITYNANGGWGAPSVQKTLIRNDNSNSCTLSAVIPNRKGYAFIGWATVPNYNTGNVYKAGYEIGFGSVDITYYAAWRKSRVSFPLDTYSFANQGYKMTVDQFKRIYGKAYGEHLYQLHTYEKNGEIIYPGEGGLCYGFSETIGSLVTDGIGVSALNTDYMKTLQWNSKFTFGGFSSSSIKEYLQYGWAYQFSESAKNNTTFAYSKYWTTQNYESLVNAVKEYENNNGDPVNICMQGRFNSSTEESAHSVYAMYIAQDSVYATVIAIYDNNYPKEITYLTMYKKDGKYYAWHYPLYSLSTTNDTATYLYYRTEAPVWKDAFTIISNNHNYISSANWVAKKNMNLTSTYLISSHKLSENNIAAEEVNKIYACGVSLNNDVYWVDGANVTLMNIDGSVSITDNEGTLTINTNDNTDISLNMVGQNIIKLNSSEISSVIYKENGETTTLKLDGNDIIILEIEDDQIIVNNADDTKITATIDNNTTKVDGYNSGNYIIKSNAIGLSLSKYSSKLDM